MNDRHMLELADRTLTHEEWAVWFAKHYQGHGRRTGAHLLQITEDAWRHRLRNADRKIHEALRQETAA